MYRIQKSLLTLTSLLGLTLIFVHIAPLGSGVPLRMNIDMFPLYIGEWVGYDIPPNDENTLLDTPHEVDDFIYRRYQDNEGRTVFLYIGYLRKFRHNASIFDGRYVSHSYGWLQLGEREKTKNINGKTIKIKEGVFKNNKQCISVSYWYQTNKCTFTDRDKGRLHQGIDAILNRKTNVALIRLASESQFSQDSTFSTEQELFIEDMLPYLTGLFPIE